MRRLVVAPRAAREIERILRVSRRDHGAAAWERYAALLDHVFDELRREPSRAGSRAAGVGDLYVYPLRFAARRLAVEQAERASPHPVVHRLDGERLQVVRLLHEAMDLPARLRGRRT